MKGKSRHFGFLLVLLAVLCGGCQEQLNYPKPSISALHAMTPTGPASITAGTPGFNLIVIGGNFTPASTVLWNGSGRVTIFNSTTSLTAEILSTDIANAGVARVEVSTPQPGGGTTTFLTFTINPTNSPIPQISSLTPSGSFVSTAGFPVTISGTNFASLATVTVNGNPRPSSFSNSSTLTVNLAASDVAQAGTLEIAVINPQPQGGTSNSVAFLVKNQTPGITSLSPTGVVAGGTGTTLTVTGTAFVPTSTVTVNGAARATAYVSATSVTATLTAGDLAAAGVDSVEVVNPAPGGGPSNAEILAVNGTPIVGLPAILDLAPDGTQANAGICGLDCNGIPTLTTAGPSTSDDGAFVVFASDSTNLILNQTNAFSNIFLRKTCLVTVGTTTTTSSSCTPSTSLVNASANNGEANGPSSQPTIDSAGDHVAYTSTASNLVNYVAVSGSGRQVYWQGTCASTSASSGCAGTTGQAALVSASADGQSAGNGESYDPVISPDGAYVAFVSTATNLVSNVLVDGITPQVYVRNTCNLIPPATGSCVPVTYLVSTPDGTTPANAASSNLAVSDTGLFVAFASTATNLGASAANPTGTTEVFVRSTCITTIGEIDNTCVPQTTIASTPDGTTAANAASTEPSISSDGRFVAFASAATNLIVGAGPTQEVYVRDTCQGFEVVETSCTPSTQLVSTPDGTTPANGLSENPSINGTCTTTVSASTPCVTGQYVAFSSLASNLGGNVENGIENVYTRDTCNAISTALTSTEELCSPYTFLSSQPPGTSPPPANGSSVAPSISGDGHTVSFLSSAENLVAHDTNGMADVFLAPANIAYTLTLSLQGTGTGTVTDSTAQINCKQTAATSTTPLTEAGTCTAQYVSGSLVTLTATASSGFSFTAWGGSAPNVTNASCVVTTDSTTTGTCEFSIIANQTATATFK